MAAGQKPKGKNRAARKRARARGIKAGHLAKKARNLGQQAEELSAGTAAVETEAGLANQPGDKGAQPKDSGDRGEVQPAVFGESGETGGEVAGSQSTVPASVGGEQSLDAATVGQATSFANEEEPITDSEQMVDQEGEQGEEADGGQQVTADESGKADQRGEEGGKEGGEKKRGSEEGEQGSKGGGETEKSDQPEEENEEHQPSAGKLRKGAGQATQAAGRGMQGAGLGMQGAGKGMKAAGAGADLLGKGLQAGGRALGAIPYVGKPLGVAMGGLGKGVSAAGRAGKKAGEATDRAGRATRKTGGKAVDLGKKWQMPRPPAAKGKEGDKPALPGTKPPGVAGAVPKPGAASAAGAAKTGAAASGAAKGAAAAKKPSAGSAFQALGKKAEEWADKQGGSESSKKFKKIGIFLAVCVANIVALIVELLLVETVVMALVFLANLGGFLWYLLKNYKLMPGALILGCLAGFFMLIFQGILILLPLIIIPLLVIGLIVGSSIDLPTGTRSSVQNIAVAAVMPVEAALVQQTALISQSAYERSIAAGEPPEVATLAALSAVSGGDADTIAATAAAGIIAAQAARGPVSPAAQDQIVAQTIAAARSVGLAVDPVRVTQLLAGQQAQVRADLLRSSANTTVDFGSRDNLILPQGNLAGLQIEDDQAGRRVVVLSDTAALVYYLSVPASGKGEVALLYRTDQLDQSQEVGAWEIDDQKQPLTATAGTETQVARRQFNLVEGNNKVVVKSLAGGPALVVEGIVLTPVTASGSTDIAASILAAGTLATADMPFATAAQPDVAELALRSQTTDQSDRFFVLTDSSNLPNASSDYELEFRWADEARWQPWADLANKTRHFPISFAVQKAYTFYGNLFRTDDAAYFLAVYSRDEGHEARAYFRVKAFSAGRAKLSNEVEFSLVPKS